MLNFVPKSQRPNSKVAGIFVTPKKIASKPAVPVREDNVPDFFKDEVKNYEKFPIALKNYIQKCFLNCNSNESKEFVSNQLFDKISSVMAQGLVLSYNWDAERLIPIQAVPKMPLAPSNSWLKLTQKPKQISFRSDFFNVQTNQKPEEPLSMLAAEECEITEIRGRKDYLNLNGIDSQSKEDSTVDQIKEFSLTQGELHDAMMR